MTAPTLPAGDWRLQVYGRTQITGASNRRKPRQTDIRRITQQQHSKCLYCGLPIGFLVWRQRAHDSHKSSGAIQLRAAWDHFVPYSYSLRNAAANWVLACHVCNGIKTARMFDSVELARAAILPERICKGYESTEAVLHRVRLSESIDFELGVRSPTGRQCEALIRDSRGFAATGISLAAIGKEMGISGGSAANLIEAAAVRLRVVGRRSAVDAAISYGFIPTQPSAAA